MSEEHPLLVHLQADDADLQRRWASLQVWIQERFEKEPTIEAILFLVGIQSLGRGYEPKLKRDVKQDLIMEGTYSVFATLGMYRRVGMEANGHWIWERLIAHPSGLSVEEQEKLLQVAILRYFDHLLTTSTNEAV